MFTCRKGCKAKGLDATKTASSNEMGSPWKQKQIFENQTWNVIIGSFHPGFQIMNWQWKMQLWPTHSLLATCGEWHCGLNNSNLVCLKFGWIGKIWIFNISWFTFKSIPFTWDKSLCCWIVRMWQMAMFIRHKWGKCKNTVGHRWNNILFCLHFPFNTLYIEC